MNAPHFPIVVDHLENPYFRTLIFIEHPPCSRSRPPPRLFITTSATRNILGEINCEINDGSHRHARRGHLRNRNAYDE